MQLQQLREDSHSAEQCAEKRRLAVLPAAHPRPPLKKEKSQNLPFFHLLPPKEGKKIYHVPPHTQAKGRHAVTVHMRRLEHSTDNLFQSILWLLYNFSKNAQLHKAAWIWMRCKGKSAGLRDELSKNNLPNTS